MQKVCTLRCDDLGRIKLTKQIIEMLEVKQRSQIRIALNTSQDGIMFVPVTNQCYFCGNTEGLSPVRQAHVCSNCANDMKIRVVS